MQCVNLKVYWQHYIDIPELAVIISLNYFRISQLFVFDLQSCQGIYSSSFTAYIYSVIKAYHSCPGNSEFQISPLK